MTLDRAHLANQLLSLFFMTIAIGLTALLVAVVAYDAGFADGVVNTIATIPVSEVHTSGSPVSFPSSFPASYSN